MWPSAALPLTSRRRSFMVANLPSVTWGLWGIGITSIYLRGIDNTEIIHAVHERPAPMIPATTGRGVAA